MSDEKLKKDRKVKTAVFLILRESLLMATSAVVNIDAYIFDDKVF